MKHPVANITIEGQGWNPHAIVAEGLPAFQKRVIEDGHYQRDESGMSLTEEQRKEVAKIVHEKAVAHVEKHKPKPAAPPAVDPEKKK